MESGMLSWEELEDITAKLCEAAERDDHESFLRIFLDGAMRFDDRKLGRDCIMDRFSKAALSASLEYAQHALAVLTRAVDMFVELADKAKAANALLDHSESIQHSNLQNPHM